MNGEGETTAVENVHRAQSGDGGRIRVPGSPPAEPRTEVRHLVIFSPPMVGYARPVVRGAERQRL
ncbi:MAG TPA: hypothetical protein VFH30_00385 [Acidimicrobiales bacterium]|nr:hypothetical protein [Acidimicrobiales bacterium]